DYKQLRDGKILSGSLFKVAEVLDWSPCTAGEAAGKPEPTDPTCEQLDYALVRLEGRPGAEPVSVPGAVATGPPRGWVRVPDQGSVPGTDPFGADAPVLIAQ